MEPEDVLLVKAAQIAELCPTCQEMLNPQKKLERALYFLRKQNLEEFQEAALQKRSVPLMIGRAAIHGTCCATSAMQ
jgi:hypothetical protein